MRNDDDNRANVRPSLNGFLRHVYRVEPKTKLPTFADLIFGVPLLSGLAVAGWFQLWSGIEVGKLHFLKDIDVIRSEQPLGFAATVVLHSLIILFLGVAAVAIIVMRWRAWRARKTNQIFNE